MILAIALLGLSHNILIHEACNSQFNRCYTLIYEVYDKEAVSTVAYSIFLGAYGLLLSAISIASLFVDRIPTIIPLVGDSFGTLFYLAGGIAWVVNIFASRTYTCGELEALDPKIIWWKDDAASICRQGNAAEGLVWALSAFTACLVICDYLRRRDLAKSSK